MIGQTLGHYRIAEKLGETQLDFGTDEYIRFYRNVDTEPARCGRSRNESTEKR